LTIVDTETEEPGMSIFSPDRLRGLRDIAGLTRPELAERAGLSPLTITAYERRKSVPSAEALGRLADALRCSVDALYDRGGDARDQYWSAACAALPPLSDADCRAVATIFKSIDAARVAREAAEDDGRPPDAA
jgi:transcriptional regulator with XRE-family HTH domain